MRVDFNKLFFLKGDKHHNINLILQFISLILITIILYFSCR